MNIPTVESNLENIKFNTSGALFYPCSGADLIAPIMMFEPFIKDFWFVDKAYFSPRHQNTRHLGLDVDAHDLPPILKDEDAYERISKTIEGPPSWERSNLDIEPCVLTEGYIHTLRKNTFNVNLRRGYGVSALRTDIPRISVFYYRGDSEGEGGSGTQWLNSLHFSDVLRKMHSGGLIVTDGSQTCGSKQYAKFATFSRSSSGYETFIENRETFYDLQGNKFECVGFAGHRYGPTLIWQLTKPT